ncbi:MAG: DHHA1 domain-containing protein [Chloroflexota bacterium]|nr:DHHA1 domain-containing protein [Chloroflexota bacterium]
METKRLYWAKPYRRAFDAVVVGWLTFEGEPAVVLDRTCFYPTSGGQPHDTGVLNDVAVVNVVERDERIIHVLSEPLEATRVHGVIDWERRYDHMQQHTGQHILSQAFERELGASTVSFHLGDEESTIDVSASTLGVQEVERVENAANALILTDCPVQVREYGREEACSMARREIPEDLERVRIVHIGDYDHSACGGTHLRSTGELGLVHISGWEQRGDHTRVAFLCGWRALSDYFSKDRICREVANDLSVAVDELPGAVERLEEAEAAARREARALRTRVLDLELPSLLDKAEPVEGLRVLHRLLEDHDAGNMRYIARNLVEGQESVVVLLAVTDPAPQICFACSSDVDVDMPSLLRDAAAPYGGRGGGEPHIAQGGGMAADDIPDVLSRAREELISRL